MEQTKYPNPTLIQSRGSNIAFQDTQCRGNLNSDCGTCGAGNDISTPRWNDIAKFFAAEYPNIGQIGLGGSEQIAAGSFFEPYQVGSYLHVSTVLT